MVDAYQVLLERGAKIKTKSLSLWADAGTPQSILDSNICLLSRDFADLNTIDQGNQEGYTIVPPVYIHPSAVIESSVIGPHVSIEANVKIINSVVRNSIIDSGAQLNNCVLDRALIGENAKIKGQARTMFIGDNSVVDLG
jgi:glucose-1-phosphate thymidylyltransferase